ncbi:Methyltransferase ctvB [Colletotrichum orbiculare MAFF 240422]|uniref:Methyltransferase ctvB n=1 Tax=Colletotrichum orbiculare (strain 104-T / ATCC 96160 / CBS 514.97 / LARS 414 / MAFF 240422) TaxID=1213857 RepID=A0A484FK41_COLOR|nr:Methyltransferase ctvB [Colletotrichum orbiculare MAFF 240422]
MGKAELGNAVYFPLFLRWAYDTLILGFICSYAWGCPRDILQGHYSKHVGPLAGRSIPRLLDIGVGTGHFVEHAPLTSGTNVLLADINKNPLSEAQGRIRRAHKDVTVDTVLANVFELGDERSSSSQRLASCVRDEGDDAFDVISCMLLLHCLPGDGARKGSAVASLSRLLKPDGSLVGATVLGKGVRHNAMGRVLMFVNNLTGIFDNYGDGASDIVEPLKAAFKSVDFRVAGTTLLFEANSPKNPGMSLKF